MSSGTLPEALELRLEQMLSWLLSATTALSVASASRTISALHTDNAAHSVEHSLCVLGTRCFVGCGGEGDPCDRRLRSRPNRGSCETLPLHISSSPLQTFATLKHR